MLDSRIAYYTRGEQALNFGDFLSEYFVAEALIAPFVEADVYRLVGSTISSDLIHRDVRLSGLADALIAYWCCGMRDAAPLDPGLLDHCRFFGIRGPLSRTALSLPADTAMGDPGLLLPLLHQARPSAMTASKTVCIPHFSERSHMEALRVRCGADVALSPAVSSIAELLRLIDDIVSADFVLSGSLHGAILACAYDRPFAFWDTGFVDIPFKWRDFAASVGIEMAFQKDINGGRREYGRVGQGIRKPATAPILGCCPFAVRPSVLLKAVAMDRSHEAGPAETAGFLMDQDKPVSGIQALNFSRRNLRRNASTDTSRAAARAISLDLQAFSAELRDIGRKWEVRATAIAAGVSRGDPTLQFGAGEAGCAFLAEGWTEPSEIGPWSLPPLSRISFPSGFGWEEASGLSIFGYAFVPAIHNDGRRRVSVWLNDTLVWDGDLVNVVGGETMAFDISIGIPAHISLAGGPLDLTLFAEEVGSIASLGLGTDDRLIGVAPRGLTWLFGTTDRGFSKDEPC